jgi:uncharacterized membrane protein YgaE (UPF0421/DUF939 family)
MISMLLLTIFIGLVTGVVASYIMFDVKHYEKIGKKAEKIEGKIDTYFHNITHSINSFSNLIFFASKHEKDIEGILSFVNFTKQFLHNSKECLDSYHVCKNF